MPDEPLIVLTIQRYHPSWAPPRDTGREWIPCRCPWHGDDSPSASVSFRHNAYKCHSCTAKGDVLALIMREEMVPYRTAVERAQELSEGSYRELSPKPARVSRRRTFGQQGTSVPVDHPGDRRKVPPWVRE